MLLALVVLRVRCCSVFRFFRSQSTVLLQTQFDCALSLCGGFLTGVVVVSGRPRIVRGYYSSHIPHLLNISRMSSDVCNTLNFNRRGFVPRYPEDARVLNRTDFVSARPLTTSVAKPYNMRLLELKGVFVFIGGTKYPDHVPSKETRETLETDDNEVSPLVFLSRHVLFCFLSLIAT